MSEFLRTFLIGIVFLLLAGLCWIIDLFFVFKKTSEANVGVFTVENAHSVELGELEKLHNLYEKKIISQSEYENRKSKLLET